MIRSINYFFTITCLILLHVSSASAQQQKDIKVADIAPSATDNTIKKDPDVFTYVDVMPETPYDLGKYLGENLRYPHKARKDSLQGRVIVKFVVNEDGSVSDFNVLRGVSPEIDNEALRVLKAMPKWKPGMNNGKPVKVYFTQPISFKIE